MATVILPQPDALPLEEAWASFSRALKAGEMPPDPGGLLRGLAAFLSAHVRAPRGVAEGGGGLGGRGSAGGAWGAVRLGQQIPGSVVREVQLTA